ncbi:uncharacterized protein LOC116943873 isoform X1 [Petromyzon marinus]|uniref:uncharacterized protein LOC116943873 isoform X1 n=1 Tax=Petromyzon marinus TaxID=7757 RepID=UPI003F7246AB
MQAADTDFGPYRPMKGGPDVMSENDPRFIRGTKQRVSLPVVRSANQSKEKTLGVLYLHYGGETRQTVMPNAVTTLDTVRALFVKAFPDVLSMAALEAPDAAFLLRDAGSTATFRLLSDLREITNKATLKVGFRAPVNRQPQALNGGDMWEESARRSHSVGYRHGSLSGSATPTVPQSPAQRHYSLQQRQQQLQQQLQQSSAVAGFISGIQGPSAFSPAAAFFGPPSPSASTSSVAALGSILERRDVRPDEDLRNRDVLLVRSDAGVLHYPQALVGTVGGGGGGGGGGGRYSLAASGHAVASSYSAGDRGGRSGPWDDSALPRTYAGSCQWRGHDSCGHHHQQQQQQQQHARSRTPPASLHALQASLAPRTVVPIALDEHDSGAGRRWAPAWGATATATLPPEQQRRKVSVGSSDTGTVTPFRPIGHVDDRETRERMESMERQIASLTELLHRSVTREDAAAASSSSGAMQSARAGTTASSAVSYAGQPAFGGRTSRAMRGRDKSGQEARATASRLHGGIAQLRAELQEIRRLQLSQRAAWQATVASVRQEIAGRLAGEAARAARDEPARRLRAQAEEERQAYVERQRAAQHRLSELEEAVETLRSRASLPGVVSLADVDEGGELLRQLEEETSALQGQFPMMQSRMQGLLRVEVEAMKFLKDEPHKLDELHRGCRNLASTLVLLRRSVVEGTPVNEPEKPPPAEPEPDLDQVVKCDAYVPHFASSHRGMLSQQEQELEQQKQQEQQKQLQIQQQQKQLQQQQEQQKQLQIQQQQQKQLQQQQEQQNQLLQQQRLLHQQQEQQKQLQQQQQQQLLQQQQEEQQKQLQLQQQQEEQQKQLQQKQKQQQEQEKKLQLQQQPQAVTSTMEVTTLSDVVVQNRTVHVTRTEVNGSEEVRKSEVRRSEVTPSGASGAEESVGSDPERADRAEVETITVFLTQVSDVPERGLEAEEEPPATVRAAPTGASERDDTGAAESTSAAAGGEGKPAADAKKTPEKKDTGNRRVSFAKDLDEPSHETSSKATGLTATGRASRSSALRGAVPAEATEQAEDADIPPPPTMSPPPPPPRSGKGFKFVRTTPAEVLFLNRKANKLAVDTRANQSEEDSQTPPPPGSSSKLEDDGQTGHMTIEVQGGDSSVKDAQPAVAFEEEITDFSSGHGAGGRKAPSCGRTPERAGGVGGDTRRSQVVFQEKDVVDRRAQAPKTITIRYIEEITSESTDEDGEPSPGAVKEKLAFLIRESHVQAVTHDEAAAIAGGDGVTTFTFTCKPPEDDGDNDGGGDGSPGAGGGGDGGGDGGGGGGRGEGGGGGHQDARVESGGDAGSGEAAPVPEVALRDKKPLIVIFDEPMDIRSAYKRLSTIFEEKDLEEYQEDETEDDDDDDDDDSSSFEYNEREAARAAAEEPAPASPRVTAPAMPEERDEETEASREAHPGEHGASHDGAAAAAAAQPSASLAEHQPPAKDGAGARSKFKIKFPRKQLAALTSALRSGTRSGKKTLELVMDGDETSDGDGDGTLASMNPYAQVDGSGPSRRAHADAEGADGRPRPENGAAGGRGDGPDGGPDDDGARWAEGATDSEHPVTWSGRNGAGESPAGAAGFPAAGMVATASPEAARAKPLPKPKPPLLPKPSFAPEQPLQNGKSASSASSVPGMAEPTSQPSTPRQGQKAMRVLHSITSSVRQVSKSNSSGGSGSAGPPTASPQRKHKA